MSMASRPAVRAVFYLLSLLAVSLTLSVLASRIDRRDRVAAAEPPAAKSDPVKPSAADGPAVPAAAKIPATHEPPPAPTIWELYQKGGVLMYPITFLSIVVVCFGLERALGLRQGKVIPGGLVKGLKNLALRPGGLDVGLARQLCEDYPSPAARVVQEMLSHVGRPYAEMEHAIAEQRDREATRLYFHVRWLNLSMSVAPMLGLLGTVQGMIIVFMGASRLPAGVNKAEYMAEGIYLKLVCTFAGLIVAIPAAVLSYAYEARIQHLVTQIEDLIRNLQARLPTPGHHQATILEPAPETLGRRK